MPGANFNKWILFQFEGAIAEKLQYAKLPILKPKDCDAYKKDYLYEKDKMMCVGYLDVSLLLIKCLFKKLKNAYESSFEN